MFTWDESARDFGVTPVENRFLKDFLPAAKGDYIKVYLWGLYACTQRGKDYSLEQMAEELFLSVPEIEAALRYWERRGLVSRISDRPARYCFYSPTQRCAGPRQGLQADDAYVTFAESVYAAFGDKRKVSPGEIALAWEWVQDVGLPPEVVLMLLHHCIEQRGVQFSFKKAEPLAVRMREESVLSPEDADSFLRHDQAVHDGARKVLSRMGKRRLPSDDELKLYEKWTGEWGFDPQAVLEACAETTKGDPSFKYLDSILSGLRARGDARTGAQVKHQLSREEEEKEKAQEIFRRLGVRLAAPAARMQYQSLCQIQPYEVLLQAANIARRSEGGRLDAMEDLARSWKRQGLTAEKDVKAYLAGYLEANVALRAIFRACGHNGRPTQADRLLYEKWKGWGMDQELLLAAGEEARAAEGSKLHYLDKVLEMWHEAGITDISQARARKKPEGGARPRGKTVSAQQYTQREYTEEELNAVSDDLIEEARKQRG